MTAPVNARTNQRAARAIDRYVPDLRTALMLMLAAVLAVSVSLISAPGWPGALGAGLAVTMLAIAVVDYRSFRIPDELNAIGLALALAHAIAQAPDAWASAITQAGLRGAVLALIFWGLRSGYAAIRGREGIGLCDVKLAAVAGAWLDWLSIPIAIQIAAFAALTVYLLRYLVSGRSLSTTHRLPFGTFLAPAIWMTWVLERVMLQAL
jgi:leader peptidase (prepilin peptidase)/N-methyltransferase